VVKLRALDRKLLRDLRGMRGQAIAITLRHHRGRDDVRVDDQRLRHTAPHARNSYYADYRFADGFASVRRAPEPCGRRLRACPASRSSRRASPPRVNLEVPGFTDAVSGLLVSLPESGQPLLNRLFVREGRLVRAGREDEVVLNEPFADAHGLQPGDQLTAPSLNGDDADL
jgi:putative ABC transport system permease protein